MTQDDLFAGERAARRAEAEPLAARMRPATLDEVVGQSRLLAPGSAFRTMVEAGRPVSMILWGPPGTGKTTLAHLVATESDAAFESLSATSAGVKDVREVLAGGKRRLEQDSRRTVLFLDEIHRFSKSQQDALLPGVERGTLILVGATTENPFFEINSPLISRAALFRLETLAPSDIRALLERALTDKERGLGGLGVTLAEDAAGALADRVGGDARLALNVLEMGAVLAGDGGIVDTDIIEEALGRRVVRYDKSGDQHYDVISAFIKSMRGSDPDAALYWLHTMLAAGEDPEFIARRMIILASEDVGLADSAALGVAVDAARALQHVGLPEGAYALSHAAVYLALAPKSNSITEAIAAATRAVDESPDASVPLHLRSNAYPGAATLGHGEGYVYPHDLPEGVAAQSYLPESLGDLSLYRPRIRGYEAELADRLADLDATAQRTRDRSRAGEE